MKKIWLMFLIIGLPLSASAGHWECCDDPDECLPCFRPISIPVPGGCPRYECERDENECLCLGVTCDECWGCDETTGQCTMWRNGQLCGTCGICSNYVCIPYKTENCDTDNCFECVVGGSCQYQCGYGETCCGGSCCPSGNCLN